MKYIHVYALLLMSIFCTSCEGQNKPDLPKDNIKSETKDTVTSYGSNERNIHTKYEYTDSIGKRLIIQNSLPKGGLRYTHSTGRNFVYAIFWTRVINKTDTPLELTMNFPADSFAIPQTNQYVKLFLPPDTMTFDKESLFDYGLDLKSFLDTGFSKPTMLQRTINPKEECLFYIATLYNRGVDSVVRAGLFLKEKDLFYRITGIETPCGQIVLKK